VGVGAPGFSALLSHVGTVGRVGIVAAQGLVIERPEKSPSADADSVPKTPVWNGEVPSHATMAGTSMCDGPGNIDGHLCPPSSPCPRAVSPRIRRHDRRRTTDRPGDQRDRGSGPALHDSFDRPHHTPFRITLSARRILRLLPLATAQWPQSRYESRASWSTFVAELIEHHLVGACRTRPDPG
jgi:hypothetical protein